MKELEEAAHSLNATPTLAEVFKRNEQCAQSFVDLNNQPKENTMFKEYAKFVQSKKKSGQDILDSLTPEKASAAHMLTGVLEEILELGEAIKNQDPENFKEEAGDVAFFLIGVLQDYGVSVGNIKVGERDEQALLSLATQIKRNIYYNKDIDLPLLEKQGQSILADLAQWAELAGTSLHELLQANQDKLNKRYAGKYSDKQAQERADKQ